MLVLIDGASSLVAIGSARGHADQPHVARELKYRTTVTPAGYCATFAKTDRRAWRGAASEDYEPNLVTP